VVIKKLARGEEKNRQTEVPLEKKGEKAGGERVRESEKGKPDYASY